MKCLHDRKIFSVIPKQDLANVALKTKKALNNQRFLLSLFTFFPFIIPGTGYMKKGREFPNLYILYYSLS